MIDEIRNYTFKALGEAIRGVEVVIATVILTALTDVQDIDDWETWALGVGVAVVQAAAAYIKGRLPRTDGT